MENGVKERLLNNEGDDKSNLKEKVCIETKKIWRVALPGVLSRVASFGSIVVTQSFMGHISELDLACYALIQALCVRFVNGILLGMSSATETLCGQAYGAGQYHMMGIYLQRSWIVDLFTLTIMLPVYIFATPFFRLLGENEDIARNAGHISMWFIPVVYSFVFSLTIQMYLQAQQKNMIIAWLAVFQFLIHIPMSWLFVNVLNWGVAGAMGSLSLSCWFVIIGEFVYIFGGWCPDTWKGFTTDAFKDLLPVLKLSLSSGVMVCLELWYNSVLVLLAGYMKKAKVAISAFSICLNITGWEAMISLGFLGAACVRVANELGRGDAKAVKFSIKVLLTTSSIIGIFFASIFMAFGNKIGYLFSNEKEVVDSVTDLSPLLTISVLLNSIYPVFSGVAVGAGLQSTVAIITLCCYYLIGITFGALLAYVAHLQAKGIWIGMICGVFTQSVALAFMSWRTNWDDEVAKASQRLKRFYIRSSEESKQDSNNA